MESVEKSVVVEDVGEKIGGLVTESFVSEGIWLASIEQKWCNHGSRSEWVGEQHSAECGGVY